MQWRRHPIVAFDTETTGLEPFAGDRIIEFAAVVLELGPDGRVARREDHSFLVNPGIPIPRKVTEITGIADHHVADDGGRGVDVDAGAERREDAAVGSDVGHAAILAGL